MFRPHHFHVLLRGAAAFAFAALIHAPAAFAAEDVQADVWQDATPGALPDDVPHPEHFRTLTLDFPSAIARVSQAARGGAAVALALPHPDGGFRDFLLSDSRTMPEELQAKYPEIVSLSGIDGEGRSVRLDISPQGLNAMVFDQDGIWIVRPESRDGSTGRYISYQRSHVPTPGGFQCETHEDEDFQPISAALKDGQSKPAASFVSTGANTRNYRAAFAANHNYVAAVCPGNVTVACGLAQVVMAVNRVNQVYETELGVHLTLIPNNDVIIYPLATGNPAPTTPPDDPYSNDTAALSQNQTNLTNVIGTANFDIGHVFTTGSGGVAGLRVTCQNGSKGRGTTGLPNPVGDDFYIDFVSHEVGHQFGGNHTFNSTTGNCGGGNRAASAAYEPGSGTTIMAYAGICSADNVQPHSDPYFHAKSLDEINTWINGNGGNCLTPVPSDHAAPVIDPDSLPPAGLTIPARTPFMLSASATDEDGDPLTYNWEQYDLGTATTLAQGDIGNGPIFRSYNATSTPTRVFPKLSFVLGNEVMPRGETWPITTRNLNFRLTVRDNHDVPGTPQFGRTESINYGLSVTADAGPFRVTHPNTNVTWGRGETHLATWDVANTNAAPVSCSTVALDLSVDGGNTWPHQLLATTPNDGGELVVVPVDVPDSTQARLRASCVGNVFFDVSDVNFTIAETGDPDPAIPSADVTPGTLDFALLIGADSEAELVIQNDGEVALNWSITESAESCGSPADVSWLSVTPVSGQTAAGDSSAATISVDTTDLEEGTYTALLCLANNDPTNALIEIPVSLTVLGIDIFGDGFED